MKKKNDFKFKVVSGPNENEIFDDCPICQAMKAAKEGGAIVSGEWFK